MTLIVGGLFGVLHFANPEMNNGAVWAGIEYLTFGFVWTYYTIKTGSIEISLGAHAANNMFLCMFITEKTVCMEEFLLCLRLRGEPDVGGFLYDSGQSCVCGDRFMVP